MLQILVQELVGKLALCFQCFVNFAVVNRGLQGFYDIFRGACKSVWHSKLIEEAIETSGSTLLIAQSHELLLEQC